MSIKDAKILIVEDEIQLNRVMELMLQADGYYKIRCAFDGNEALDFIKSDKPDLILLDVMIPELDGYSLCKIIKNDDNYRNTKVIMITAKKMEDDVLEGFRAGAIDYITKPFSNKILLARIKAHLESFNSVGGIKKYKDITIDTDKMIVKLQNKEIELTNFEYKILDTFISNIGIVFSRSALLSILRGDEGFNISERAVDVQIVNLRRKLGERGQDIETIRGSGYKLKEII